jgi:hypothetical protein
MEVWEEWGWVERKREQQVEGLYESVIVRRSVGCSWEGMAGWGLVVKKKGQPGDVREWRVRWS